MKKYNVAILGATGAVGQEMLKVLGEYDIPVERLEVLSSARSAGKKINWKGRELECKDAASFDFSGLDFVLGAVEKAQSKEFAPKIVKAGAVYIDNSSAFRMDPEVPLVVPEINGKDALSNKGIIANPNCSTIITMMALGGIAKLSEIETLTACTYQAVSGAGQAGIEELEREMDNLAKGEETQPKTFPVQIAMNVIPFIGSLTDNDYTDEEMKMQNEGRKILHMPDMKCTCTCVRVPVMRSHSIAVSVKTKDYISVEQAKEAIGNFEGVALFDANGRTYPTPLDTTDGDTVMVGRIRRDLIQDNSLTLWCCGDQIRKGAAANCVQIMKYLIENN